LDNRLQSLHPIPRLKGKDAMARAKTVGLSIPAKFSAGGGCHKRGIQESKEVPQKENCSLPK